MLYDHNAKQMPLSHEFLLPSAGTLNAENRWCKLAVIIPWEKAEKRIIENMGNLDVEQRVLSVRVALGILIIQNVRNFSDRETAQEISEKPYRKYFI